MADQHSQLKYRKASLNDIDQLVELRVQQLLDEGYPEDFNIRQDLTNYFSANLESGSLICWVGTDESIIRATAGICFYQLPPTFSNPTGRIAYITNMYTEPSCRKQGVASLLLNKLILEAKGLNYASVRLHASELGRGVYEEAGFVTTEGYMALKL
ncbi:MAG: GNAT family N-acetyltransferase [Pseudomonadota bacterium]